VPTGVSTALTYIASLTCLQIISLVALQHYRPPIPADCPAPLADLMLRCWSADPADR